MSIAVRLDNNKIAPAFQLFVQLVVSFETSQCCGLTYFYNGLSPYAHVRIRPLHGRYAGVQQHTVVIIGKKHFRRRYGTTQATNRPSLAYYNTDNNIFSICEPCTGTFVRCPTVCC